MLTRGGVWATAVIPLETVEHLAEEMSELRSVAGWKSRCRLTITRPTRLREEELDIPLASGEHEPNEAGYLDLIDSDCVDYVQMDVCCQGGFAHGAAVVQRDRATGTAFRLS